MKIRKFFKIFKEEMEKGYKEEKKRQDENKAIFVAKNEKKASDFFAKHKFATALIILLPIFLLLNFINSFFPLTVYDDINGMEPANGIEYFSEEYKVGNKTVAVYACLDAASEYVANQGDNQFVINVAEIKGPLKNRYYLYSSSFMTDDEVLSPEYKSVFNFPEYEIKSGSRYYGSVYAGIVPSDCESITIGGVEAEMERFTFDLNGKNADFYLYYCVIEQDEYPDELPVICQRTNGELLSISSVDGEDSKVTLIENNYAVEVFGHYYEECDPSWHPYGNTTEKENCLVYDNDNDNIFINMPDSLFSEGITYHRNDDVYPVITQTDRIEKIILENGNTEIAIEEEYLSAFSKVLSFSDIDTADIVNLDYGKDFFFVNIYYENYPAYQNEYMLTLSDEEIPIIAFCETEKNTQIIGDGKALAINDKRLVEYFKSVLN